MFSVILCSYPLRRVHRLPESAGSLLSKQVKIQLTAHTHQEINLFCDFYGMHRRAMKCVSARRKTPKCVRVYSFFFFFFFLPQTSVRQTASCAVRRYLNVGREPAQTLALLSRRHTSIEPDEDTEYRCKSSNYAFKKNSIRPFIFRTWSCREEQRSSQMSSSTATLEASPPRRVGLRDSRRVNAAFAQSRRRSLAPRESLRLCGCVCVGHIIHTHLHAGGLGSDFLT